MSESMHVMMVAMVVLIVSVYIPEVKARAP